MSVDNHEFTSYSQLTEGQTRVLNSLRKLDTALLTIANLTGRDPKIFQVMSRMTPFMISTPVLHVGSIEQIQAILKVAKEYVSDGDVAPVADALSQIQSEWKNANNRSADRIIH